MKMLNMHTIGIGRRTHPRYGSIGLVLLNVYAQV